MMSFKKNTSNYISLIVFMGCVVSLSMFSRPSSAYAQVSGKVYNVVDKMPAIKNGLSSLYKKIKYPDAARKAGISGRVYIQFIVDASGNVEKPKVLKGIGGGCDKAALAGIKEVKFNPGMLKGKAVNVRFTLPITFRLKN